MNKISVKSGQEYEVEVNDKGETIIFDLSDIGLPARLIECYNKLKELSIESDKERNKIMNMPNGNQKYNDLVTIRDYEMAKALEKYYKQARETMDMVLGKNACQKIFGDKNFPNMFDKLFQQLDPHIKKMGLSLNKMKKQLKQKYTINNNKILK